MSSSLAVPNERPWPLGPYAPEAPALGKGQRSYAASNILDFPTLLRIVHHWRWLVLGAVILGLAGAILSTLMTTPVYRSSGATLTKSLESGGGYGYGRYGYGYGYGYGRGNKGKVKRTEILIIPQDENAPQETESPQEADS